MDWLNYHHLFYFWNIAKAGSITAAAQRLRLAQPTVSTQLRQLEEQIGAPLFERHGRRLVLTETGQLAMHYADEIFLLGNELRESLAGRPTGRPRRFEVGIADSLPKLLAVRLLAPALRLPEPVQLVLYEDRTEKLLADLSIQRLDLVLADAPIGPGQNVRAFSHLLLDCEVTVFGTAALVAKHRRGFPRSLDGAPFLWPMEPSPLRRQLDQHFSSLGVAPLHTAEIQDSATLKAFGEAGLGLFAAPAIVKREIERQYRVRSVGSLPAVRERVYGISVERKITHPATAAIARSAKQL